MKRFVLPHLVSLAVLTFAAGCGSPADSSDSVKSSISSCQVDADCNGGEVCQRTQALERTQQALCSADEQVCYDDLGIECVPFEDNDPFCSDCKCPSSDDDDSSNDSSDGANDTSDTSDSSNDESSGRCVAVGGGSQGSSSGGSDDSGQAGDESGGGDEGWDDFDTSDEGDGFGDSGGDGSGDSDGEGGSSGGKKTEERCYDDSECESGICAIRKAATYGVCSFECTDSFECWLGASCRVRDSGDRSYCYQD